MASRQFAVLSAFLASTAASTLTGPDVAATFAVDALETASAPRALQEACNVNDLLPNGDFESGSAEPWSPADLVEGGYGGSAYALISTNRQNWHGPNVDINLDCLQVGDIIAVTGKLRLMEGSNPATCSAHMRNGVRCPTAFLKIKDKNGKEQTYSIGYITGWHPDADGWYDITGQFQLPDFLDGYQGAKFAIYDTDGSRDIVIDNFKMYKVPYQCASLNRNPTFDNGDLSFWYPDGNRVSRIKAFSPGASGDPSDFALRSYSRGMNYRGASFFLDKRCLKDGLVYTITAKIKLVDSTGNPQKCNPSITDPNHRHVCPTVVLKGDNCPDGAEVRLWNEIDLGTWDADGFNEFKATFPTNDKMGQCTEPYLIVGRDVHKVKDVVLDDVYVIGGEGAAALREDTLAPTNVPTNVPSTFPSASPTFSPTNKPTPFPTIANAVACPDPSEDPKEMPSGPVMLARSDPGKVCIIMKAIQDADGNLSKVAPVARSHNGERWTRYGGKFAESLFYGWDFDHHDIGSQITFPELSGDEKYFASSYSYSVENADVSEKDVIARFLNTATFGVTTAEIEAFKGPVTKKSAADWIQEQMDEPATSHREFLRKRSNARLISQRVQYTPDHPCDAGSRWRSYTFSRNDGYNYWNKLKIGLEGDGPYVITLGGHARTTVTEFPWAREKHPVFDQTRGYDFCDRPEERINGTVKMRVKTCESFKNPPIYFDTSVTDLPNPVVPLPAIGDGLEVIDTHMKSNGQEFILVNGLDDDVCSKLPGVHDENKPPMFGQLPDGTWLQFDPHFDVMENTVENPLSDGGGIKTFLTDGYTQCSNVARSLFNEHGCKLSSEPTTCQGSYRRSDIKIDLNADSMIAMRNITGKYIYAITNLPLKGDSDNPVVSACKEGAKSRWEVLPSNECVPTDLDDETLEALTAVLVKSPDTNAFIRDITFPKHVHHCSAESKESLEEVSIIIDSECFKRVHPDHLSIYDMSYCAKDNNPCMLDTSNGHPIKDLMKNEDNVFLDYLGQPNRFFDESAPKFTKVGRFGDTILFRDLGYGLTSDDIAIYFGNSDSVPSSKILVCGSQNEVANEPSLGHHFDITTGQDNHHRKIVAGRESVWAMLALSAKDQLRQRIAWALAQLLVVVPSQVNSSGSTHAEAFLHYYDIFVRHAFGNYGDILREVTYSPLMGENLSYGGSRSGGYNFEKEGKFTFADENYAREIMQLFSVGLNLLNEDGTEKRDEVGDPISTYTNDEIMSFARVFTGFERVPPRGNSEEIWFGRNVMDPMTIEAAYRDKFPKHDLTGGYIGDGYPLCSDLPPKMFLRKGATYKLLGDNPAPREYEDSKDLLADPTMKLFVLEADSALRAKLCNPAGGQCAYDPVVTLDTNLDCFGEECLVDEPRAVKVGDIFYEYVRPACVEQVFYSNPLRVTYVNQYYHSLCANPKLPLASEACLQDPKKPTKVCLRYSKYVFDQERVTYATAQARCEEDGLQTSWFHFIQGIENQKKGFHWTNTPCAIKAKVNPDGLVSIVHDIPGVTIHSNANMESRNFFKVYWSNSIYPKNDLDGDDGNSCGNGACTPLEEGGCLCSISAFEGKVFNEMPARPEDVLSNLYIGAYDPSSFDEGTYTIKEGDGVKAYLVDNEYSPNTVFEVTDAYGRTRLLKNSKEFVRIDGSGFSFRSAPSFMSILNEEASLRDARYEVDATIDHLLYHPNTAPFIAIRLIQRFVTSNPTPDYVKAVATAFRTGKYDNFGSGKYGDLAATISAVLLEPDALSVVLDVDPFHGSIREPLLKAVAFMRSMELEMIPEKKVLELAYPFKNKIGQMAHSFDTVFSFFLPENIPTGKPGAAMLYSPEAMLVDMPKVTGLLNGLYSTIKNGISNCYYGFGDGWSVPCEEGDFTNAVAKLSFDTSAEDAAAVVSELSTLLTSGRISQKNKELIIDAYTSKLPDKAAALRIAQQLIVSTPEFHSFDTVKSSGETRETVSNPPPSGAPYKAVIFLMLQGGADSFNMLVPHTCSPKDLYSEYKKVRGAVSMPLSSLLEIDASSSNQACTSFGMHPKLVTAKQLYDDGDLVWFANAGVLTRPTDKDKYKSHTKAALFAHNSMKLYIQRLDPFKTDVETGALGRIADALQKQENLSVEKYNLYKGSYSLDGHYGPEPFIVDGNGVPKFNEAPSDEGMEGVIKSLNGATEFDSGVFADLFSNLFVNSIDANKKLTDALDQTANTTATFGTDSMGTAFNMVARLIATRELRGVDRDFFFIPHSNWDAHNKLEWNLNTNLADLDNAINAFSTEMKTEGLWESTTIIQASDFGRSLEPNGGDGTDHAWGGNYMMMGGAVSGGKIVGKYPEILTDDGPEILERGRIIPTLSWDEIIVSIAEWTGVSPQSVKDVCPNIDNFPETQRIKTSDLFVDFTV